MQCNFAQNQHITENVFVLCVGNGWSRRLFAGLSIRADEVIAPLEPVYHRSENQFSQLLDSMRQMSVLQNDVSGSGYALPSSVSFLLTV